MSRPKMAVLASGSKDGGGSGLRVMLENIDAGVLDAEITSVFSNWPEGGVRKVADKFGIQFYTFAKPFSAGKYRDLVLTSGADWFSCSGWLKLVRGFEEGLLSSRRWFNIHPGLLPEFGGKGMFGHHVHEATVKAFKEGKVAYSAVSMHFVDKIFDHGALFFQLPVAILKGDTPDDLGDRVNEQEHGSQSLVTDLVIHEEIRLEEDGSVAVPLWYQDMPYCPEHLRAA